MSAGFPSLSEAKADRMGKVLVVDDEAANRSLFATMLESDGHEVVVAGDGHQALSAAAEASPDVVLLDVMMPELNGYDVCRRLKADAETAAIPVIMLTGLSMRDSRLEGIRAGANDFINKPADLTELRLRVRNAIHSKRLYDQVRAGYARLEKLEALREDLTGMIVHDMRSPLMGISGFLELLQMSTKEVLPEEDYEFLGRALESSQQLMEMVNSLLDVSRLENGQMPLCCASHDLVKMAGAAVGSLGSLTRDGRVEIQAAGEVYAYCDEQLIRRVIANLVGNGVKFSPKDRPVRVSVSGIEGLPTVTVADEGGGIPAEFHERIFEKFGQVDPCARKVRSSGLGLAFCKLAVEAHGGEIRLRSAPGEGSEFRMVIPTHAPVLAGAEPGEVTEIEACRLAVGPGLAHAGAGP
jgi:two-component system sensor histidine kinase/response regulator